MHRGDKKHVPLEWEDSLRLVRCIPSTCGRTSFGVIDQLMPQCDRLPLRKTFSIFPWRKRQTRPPVGGCQVAQTSGGSTPPMK